MTHRAASLLQRGGALALVLVMLCAIPAVAEPATSTPEPTPSDPAPATTSQPDRSTTDSTPLRTPPSEDETSPIEVPTDGRTEEFRAELARRQARLDEFKAQLDELDRELALAAEAYNHAADQLDSTRQKVAQTSVDLRAANEAYKIQLDLLESRANSIYKQGTFAAMEVLLDSKSVSDFVARVKFLNTIGLADADVAASLRAQKQMIEEKAAELEDAEKQAEALEFELKARQIEVMIRIQERQEMLAQAQEDLLELLDQEAARRSQQEAELLRAILSGADAAGIEVVPGSPVETALAYHGIPYLWGGSTPAGFDCSGLVLYVFRQHGVELPHYSGSQFLLGEKVAPAALQPGDVVFFGSPIHHVGIYIGGGYFIHAPRTGDFVKISPLADRKDYAGARRYNWVPRTSPPEGIDAPGYESIIGNID